MLSDAGSCVKVVERPIIFSGPMVRAILEGRKTQTRRPVNPPAVDMVQFIVADNKPTGEFGWCSHERVISRHVRCPYGVPGDRLWVRETHYITAVRSHECGVGYRADHATGNLADGDGGYNFRQFSDDPDKAGEQWNWANNNSGTDKWRPAIFMPRWASRITLEITDVRVQRVQEISEEDAQAEGVEPLSLTKQEIADLQISDSAPWEKELARLLGPGSFSSKFTFEMLWDEINAKRDGGKYAWAANPWVWALTFRRIEK